MLLPSCVTAAFLLTLMCLTLRLLNVHCALILLVKRKTLLSATLGTRGFNPTALTSPRNALFYLKGKPSFPFTYAACIRYSKIEKSLRAGFCDLSNCLNEEANL